MRTTLIAALIVVFLACPGCIVGEMRDELAATRAGVERLAALAPALEKTNAALEQSNRQMAAMYEEIVAARRSLDSVPPQVDRANAHLQRSTEMLAHLEPMQASLRNLDESLAALRKMVENIDRAIPLVNFTSGMPSADKALEKSREEKEKAGETPVEKPK